MRNPTADLRRFVRMCGVENGPEPQSSLLISADVFTSAMVFYKKCEDILFRLLSKINKSHDAGLISLALAEIR